MCKSGALVLLNLAGKLLFVINNVVIKALIFRVLSGEAQDAPPVRPFSGPSRRGPIFTLP
jgi:hypothetical protein